MILTKKTTGIFNIWNTVFTKIMESEIIPEDGYYFIEQSSFAIASLLNGMKTEFLPPAYNIPIHSNVYRKQYRETLKDGISFHYHSHLFREKGKSFCELIGNYHPKSLLIDYLVNEINKEFRYSSFIKSGIFGDLSNIKKRSINRRTNSSGFEFFK